MTSQQLNRREMLSASVVGAAGVLWSRCLPAANGLEMLSFVVVSDTHLGRNDNDAAERNWRQAIAEINESTAQFVLHLGDVVDGGREAQYPVYAETRKLINKPIHRDPRQSRSR